jgi:hypothetical protein
MPFGGRPGETVAIIGPEGGHAMGRQRVLEHLREQSGYCEEYGSAFTARLLERVADDLAAGGPVADLIADWAGPPRSDVVGLRMAGALHAAALIGRDPALAAQYPEQRAQWRMDELWPIARAFLARERAWVLEFLRSAPQTNEVRRSIALVAAFMEFARAFPGEFDTLEIGASAGLNLHWDRYRYTTRDWSWGPSAGVTIDTEWHGPPPPIDSTPRVRMRAASDLRPLDIGDPAQRLQLRSYIWADQRERLARFDAAADLALATGVRVERADAAQWLARKLEERAVDRATVVYHTVFLQYPPRATRDALEAMIALAGERATDRAPLAWLRLEPEGVLGGDAYSPRFLVDLTTWPGGQRRILAHTDGHLRALHWLIA